MRIYFVMKRDRSWRVFDVAGAGGRLSNDLFVALLEGQAALIKAVATPMNGVSRCITYISSIKMLIMNSEWTSTDMIDRKCTSESPPLISHVITS